MSKILKAANVRIDENNRVSVEVLDYAAIAEMQESLKNDAAYEPEEEDLSVEDEISLEEASANIIEQAEERAENILTNASREAEEIIERRRTEFEDELANLKEETLKEAFELGYGRGYDESEGVRKQADDVLQAAYAEREETFENMEPEIIELICGLVKKLTAGACLFNPDIISCLIKQGLGAANAPGDVTVHVSAEDYEEAVKNKYEFLTLVETGARVDIILDPSLKISDCIIETPYGNIDCSLGQQFASLKENIYYILNNG